MNFSKMMKNVKVMDKIIDNKDFKLLEKQDDDMLISIGKHILIHHFSDIKEYHKQLNVYESLPREKKLFFIKTCLENDKQVIMCIAKYVVLS